MAFKDFLKTAKEKASATLDGIKGVASNAADQAKILAKTTADNTAEKRKALGKKVTDTTDSVADTVYTSGKKIAQTVDNTTKPVRNAAQGVTNKLAQPFKKAAQQIKDDSEARKNHPTTGSKIIDTIFPVIPDKANDDSQDKADQTSAPAPEKAHKSPK